MKIDAIKLKVKNFAFNMADQIFPPNSVLDRMKNATAKFWVQQNIYKLDPILCAFADLNGEIDIDMLCQLYEQLLFENDLLKVNIKSMIPKEYEYLNSILPEKVVIFNKQDLYSLFC